MGYFFSIHLKQKVYQHDSIIAKPTFLVNSGLQLANGVYWPMAPSNTCLILLLTCNSKKPIYCALLQEYPHTTTHFALFMTTKRIDKLYHIDSNQKCSTHTNCLPLLRTTHTHTHTKLYSSNVSLLHNVLSSNKRWSLASSLCWLCLQGRQ